jgi:uncharacterized membrane protein YdbT with pleckstrin-like domain
MAYPRKLLIPGEEIVLELRPHMVALALPALVALASVVLGVWLMIQFDGFMQTLVVVVALVALVVYPLRQLVWWVTSDFVVTTSRVIHREGFIAKRSMEIPLDKINDVRFEQGIVDRVLGAGTIVIQSASESGRNQFSFIRRPEEVQRTIYHQSELDQERTMRGPATPPAPAQPATPPTPPASPSVTTELERLAELRAKGVLTEEEFEAQKARILGRG